MKLGVRGKLFLVSLFLIMWVTLVVGVFLESELKRQLESRIEAELLRHARTARVLIEKSKSIQSPLAIDTLADRLGDSTRARVTIVLQSGRIIGDSKLSEVEFEQFEGHSERPEIQDATKHGYGLSRRFSTTTATPTLYVALPFSHAEGKGVVRVAMALADVEAATKRLRILLLLSALLGLALAVVLSAAASHYFTRTLRILVQNARSATHNLPAQGANDEVEHLAGSLKQLTQDLEDSVSDLAHERDHLETILDSMSESVIALDDQGRISRINHAALKLLGLGAAPKKNTAIIEAIRVPALSELLAEVEKREKLCISEFDIPLAKACRVLVHAAPLQATRGQVLVLHDVTEMRRLETMRQDFVANVSHELRTPVSVIKANAETLLTSPLNTDKDAHRFLDGIRRHADSLASLISDILDLSKIEAKGQTMQSAAVPLLVVAKRSREALSQAAAKRRIHIQIEIHPQIQSRCDEKALEQILTNLLDNAIKYTDEDSTVIVRAEENNDVVTLEVADTGAGIAKEHRARIFERFYRVDAGRSRDMGGTGLGLAIVKHLVLAMNGAVGIKSNEPRGTIFWISLPPA